MNLLFGADAMESCQHKLNAFQYLKEHELQACKTWQLLGHEHTLDRSIFAMEELSQSLLLNLVDFRGNSQIWIFF